VCVVIFVIQIDCGMDCIVKHKCSTRRYSDGSKP